MIVRPVPVDIGAISIEIANIDEVAIGIAAFLCAFSSMHRLRIIKPIIVMVIRTKTIACIKMWWPRATLKKRKQSIIGEMSP